MEMFYLSNLMGVVFIDMFSYIVIFSFCLFSLLADTRESAEGALNASRAYQAIVDAINSAEEEADDAITAADKSIASVCIVHHMPSLWVKENWTMSQLN